MTAEPYPGFVTPLRARLVRIELDMEHADAVRAGEVRPGLRPVVQGRFPAARRLPAPVRDEAPLALFSIETGG